MLNAEADRCCAAAHRLRASNNTTYNTPPPDVIGPQTPHTVP